MNSTQQEMRHLLRYLQATMEQLPPQVQKLGAKLANALEQRIGSSYDGDGDLRGSQAVGSFGQAESFNAQVHQAAASICQPTATTNPESNQPSLIAVKRGMDAAKMQHNPSVQNGQVAMNSMNRSTIKTEEADEVAYPKHIDGNCFCGECLNKLSRIGDEVEKEKARETVENGDCDQLIEQPPAKMAKMDQTQANKLTFRGFTQVHRQMLVATHYAQRQVGQGSRNMTIDTNNNVMAAQVGSHLGTQSGQPLTQSSQQLTQSSQSWTQSSQPWAQSSQPWAQSSQQLTQSSQPWAQSGQPLTQSNQSPEEHAQVRCEYKDCPNTFDSKRIMKYHLAFCHNPTKKWYCNKCDKHFDTYRQLMPHQSQCNQLGQFRRTEQQQQASDPNKPFKCTYPDCSYSARRKADALQHIRRMHLAHNPTHVNDPTKYLKVV